MSKVRGCEFPEHLYYDVEHNIWLSAHEDLVTVGMTSYACSLAGEIVALTTKKVGKSLKPGQSCATVESGKWVGPVKVPIHCEIVQVNQTAVLDPSIINQDPYADGWIVRVSTSSWQQESQGLLTGDAALQALEDKMAADGFGGC